MSTHRTSTGSADSPSTSRSVSPAHAAGFARRTRRTRRALTARGTRRRAAVLAAAVTATAALAGPASTAAHAEPAAPRLGQCASGQLCLWQQRGWGGERHVYELPDTGTESCVRVPGGAGAGALANRTGRPVTAYQSDVCDETGEFQTYPSGSWAPETPYVVRAFKVWER
ncbi:peptidase inhibitor family I36 protein [Streptomyces sp. TRM 70351]|uniref:peptidase inhibitor family I36 protein n=1 Tax=Streptomyces sp. TRM 70351 TaxID=3116552 RepID=UPI002E7B9A94|nr:peptidase inhibitor family I36 protein [Streptomyces sp. TRM 70351]MEE1928520.1 peptidase inhibitor family I36 protein [Streptomyces sp. TRM 70351]